MKKIYSILLISVCFCGYAQHLEREIPKNTLIFPSDYLNDETLIFKQEELEKRYLEAKNYHAFGSIKQQFLNSNNADSEVIQLVSIDLESIQVLESPEMHTITYKVTIGEDEFNENGDPLVVYNLMHWSTNYNIYYFILLKYDFSKTSYEDFSANPHENKNVLSFIPLSDIGNIYENIAYSFAKELLINPDLLSKNSPFYTKMIDFGNCARAIDVPGVACKTCGIHFYETVDGKYCQHKDPQVSPKPAYTFLDLSPCNRNLETKEINLASF